MQALEHLCLRGLIHDRRAFHTELSSAAQEAMSTGAAGPASIPKPEIGYECGGQALGHLSRLTYLGLVTNGLFHHDQCAVHLGRAVAHLPVLQELRWSTAAAHEVQSSYMSAAWARAPALRRSNVTVKSGCVRLHPRVRDMSQLQALSLCMLDQVDAALAQKDVDDAKVTLWVTCLTALTSLHVCTSQGGSVRCDRLAAGITALQFFRVLHLSEALILSVRFLIVLAPGMSHLTELRLDGCDCLSDVQLNWREFEASPRLKVLSVSTAGVVTTYRYGLLPALVSASAGTDLELEELHVKSEDLDTICVRQLLSFMRSSKLQLVHVTRPV